jgi:chitin synthase
MDNRVHRTPSPGHPLQHGYHLEDNPYGHHSQQNLDIPTGPARYPSPGDSLQMQTAVSPASRRQSMEIMKGC